MLPMMFSENLFDDLFNDTFGRDMWNKDGYLTITASKGLDKDEKEKKTRRVIRQERYVGTSQRTFYVGDVRPEEVKCKYESGVLTINVPKADARRIENPHTIMIEG